MQPWDCVAIRDVSKSSVRSALSRENEHPERTGDRARLYASLKREGIFDALQDACDVYVSMHLAEGFGLTMAGTMARGKPVVGTGYGGNLSFMSPANSILVPATLIGVGSGKAPYLASDSWAEPDIGFAALALRRLRDTPVLRHELGRAARASLRPRLDASAAAAFVRQRFSEIQRRIRDGGPVALGIDMAPRTMSLPLASAPLSPDALIAIRAIARRPRLFRAVMVLLATMTRIARRVRKWRTGLELPPTYV